MRDSEFQNLQGKRVLIVEDEMLIAIEIESSLTQYGCHIVGPAQSIEIAESLINSTQVDVAILDVNLNGQLVAPVIENLRTKNISFLLLTGYDIPNLPLSIENYHVVQKPFTSDSLINSLLLTLLP